MKIQPTELMKTAVMWYCTHILPTMRKMPRSALLAMAEETAKLSDENALHLVHEKKFVVPSWSPESLTGLQVVALMLMTTWVLCNEDERIAHPLMDQWYMTEVLALVGKKTDGTETGNPS